MANFAQQRRENHIPYLEEIKRSQIFSSEDLRKMCKEINRYEFIIQKPGRSLNDYLNYVNYQLQILKTVKRERENENIAVKEEMIEKKICEVIAKVLGSAAIVFKSDPKLWEAQIMVFTQMGWKRKLSNVYDNYLLHHGKTIPSLYCRSSKMELSIKKSNLHEGFKNARQRLMEGLRFHENNMEIALEAFNLELNFVEFLNQKEENRNDSKMGNAAMEDILNLKLAKLIWEKVEPSAQPKNYIAFHLTARNFPRTMELSQEILTQMRTRHVDNDEVIYLLKKLVDGEF